VAAYDQNKDLSILTVRQANLEDAQQATLQQEGMETAAITKLISRELQRYSEVQDTADEKSAGLDPLSLSRLVNTVDRLQLMRRRSVQLATTNRVQEVEDVPNEQPIFYAANLNSEEEDGFEDGGEELSS